MGGAPHMALPELRRAVVVWVASLLELRAHDRGDRQMGGLAEELAALAASNRSAQPRLMERILASFADDDRAMIEAALKDPAEYSSYKLSAFFKRHDRPISESAISQWRREHGYR